MAKSEMTASLKLNSQDYEDKLAKAKRSTRKFSQDGMSEFTKFATALAGSKVAMEAFNRAVESSQIIGDKYARTMSTAKSITDQFVYSIANADFTKFTNGLKDVRKRASDAYDALDQLGNTEISYKFYNARERSTFREGILTAKDTTLTPEERQAGLEVARGALGRMTSMTEVLTANTEDYLRKEIAKIADLDVNDVEIDALAKTLAVDISANASQIRQDIVDKYAEYQRRYAEEVAPYASRTTYNAQGYPVANLMYNQATASANAGALDAEFAEVKTMYALLNRISDKDLQGLANQRMAVDQYKFAMGELVTQLREAEKQLNTQIKSGTVGSAIGADSKSGQGIDVSQYSTGGAPIAGMTRERATASIEMSEEYANALRVLDETAVSASEGLGAIGSVIGSFSGALDEQSGAWLSYAGNIVNAVASALPALEALAAAQAAAAVTKTALSPWTVASAVAAIASIGAAMASVPKFATGGVVPGNMMSGDNVLIRANSGEVVLTKAQANNIGTMLSSGMGGRVEFRIKGDTLVGVLKNHNKIASRSYGA